MPPAQLNAGAIGALLQVFGALGSASSSDANDDTVRNDDDEFDRNQRREESRVCHTGWLNARGLGRL